jgi:DNA-binding CsgD family transcriptional regulator
MPRPVEVLERIAASRDAVFAFDANDLIVLWNKGCERLLGRAAYQVLGRRCYDVICGRDVYGNQYCSANCPVVTQARIHPEQELHPFLLDVPVAGGRTRRVSVTPYPIPGGRPELATIVHVVKDPDAAASPLEKELAAASAAPGDVPRRRTGPGPLEELSDREKEILRKLAEGLSTSAIATELFISPVTVRNHVARILGKLGVHTKLAAVALAYQRGLVGPDLPTLPTLPAAARTGREGARGRRSRRA